MIERLIPIHVATDEEFFQTALDAYADDSAARLLLAEWFAARGSQSAAGYWWLATEAILPQDYPATRTWDWNDELQYSEMTGTIPHSLFEQLKGGKISASSGYREYRDRRAAEEALCRVFAEENLH
jgi:hypothetical protein